MFPTTHLPSSDVLSLPLLYPIPNTPFVPLATPPQPFQVYTRRLHTDIRPPADSSPMAPSSMTPVLPSLDDPPIAIRKGICSSHNPHPIYNFLTYLHHILLLFPPCLLFLFLTLYMRPTLIRAGNRLLLRKWLLSILLAHGT